MSTWGAAGDARIVARGFRTCSAIVESQKRQNALGTFATSDLTTEPASKAPQYHITGKCNSSDKPIKNEQAKHASASCMCTQGAAKESAPYLFSLRDVAARADDSAMTRRAEMAWGRAGATRGGGTRRTSREMSVGTRRNVLIGHQN